MQECPERVQTARFQSLAQTIKKKDGASCARPMDGTLQATAGFQDSDILPK